MIILNCVLILQINIHIWFAWRSSIEIYRKYRFEKDHHNPKYRLNMSTILNYDDRKEKNNDFCNICFLHVIWWNEFIKSQRFCYHNSTVISSALRIILYSGWILIIPRFHTICQTDSATVFALHFINFNDSRDGFR